MPARSTLALALRALLCLALVIPVACQRRGEPELTLTQEQWRRVRVEILPELPDDIETPLNIRYGDALTLMGVEGLPRQIHPGEAVEITAYWSVSTPPTGPVEFRVGLRQGDDHDTTRHVAMRGQYPSRLWAPGVIFRDRFTLRASPAMSGLANLTFEVLEDDALILTDGENPPKASQTIVTWTAPRLAARHTDTRIIIDGRDDEAPWANATPTAAWRDAVDGSDIDDDTTSVRALWNASGLYLFIVANDGHIWGTMSGPDMPIWEQESLHVFLDAGRTHEDYLEIAINPLNTVFDALYSAPSEEGSETPRAHRVSGLRSAVVVQGTLNAPADDDFRWTAELFIPFDELPGYAPLASGRPGVVGINLYRYDRPDDETRIVSAWSPVGAGTLHRPERFGVIDWLAATRSDDTQDDTPAPAHPSDDAPTNNDAPSP